MARWIDVLVVLVVNGPCAGVMLRSDRLCRVVAIICMRLVVDVT